MPYRNMAISMSFALFKMSETALAVKSVDATPIVFTDPYRFHLSLELMLRMIKHIFMKPLCDLSS